MLLVPSHAPDSLQGGLRRRVATLAIAGLVALLSSTDITNVGLRAQAPSGPDTTSSTTDDSTGIVNAISAVTISVADKRGPFTYRLGPDLHVVGTDGAPLTVRAVRVGQRVTVYYYLRDGQPTAARIAILKSRGAKDKDR